MPTKRITKLFINRYLEEGFPVPHYCDMAWLLNSRNHAAPRSLCIISYRQSEGGPTTNADLGLAADSSSE